jgi:hypothetical protein
MRDLKDPRWMYAKAILFLLAGAASALLVFMEQPTFRAAVLLGILAWSSARAYYFAFYVIERYIDPSFRFSGLGSLVAYLVRSRRRNERNP